jgi:hypothetical protein
MRLRRVWSYAQATQIAAAVTEWEQLDPAGDVIARWQRGPIPLHSVTRFEMEHLFGRAGYAVEALYGDFFGSEFQDGSESMIWVLRT